MAILSSFTYILFLRKQVELLACYFGEFLPGKRNKMVSKFEMFWRYDVHETQNDSSLKHFCAVIKIFEYLIKLINGMSCMGS